MSDTEPGAAERAAPGAAPVEPGDPLVLSRDEWDAVLRVARMLGQTHEAQAEAAIAAAVAAEKERIAQAAEDLGAHYHERLERTRGRAASFADFLRGAKS